MLSRAKLFLAALPFLFFGGCAMQQPVVQKGYEKSFEQEDVYILTALYMEESEDYDSASKMFETLYEKSDKKEYFYRSLKNDMAAQRYERVVRRADAAQEKIQDPELKRFKIVALVKQNKFLEAKDSAIKLVELSRSVDDYLLAGDIYVKLKEYDKAVAYLEKAYLAEHNEKIIGKIAVILYVNLQRKKDAVAQLETHSRIHGCSLDLCSMLAGFYSNDNDIEGLLSTYLRMYKIEGNSEIAKKIVQIYGYKKEYPKMTEFLEESRADDELLLQLYIQAKEYKKAAPMAKELYEKTGDAIFLGQSAIFEYESSEDKSDKSVQNSVVAKLKEVIEIKRDAMYLNYLGYLLIDHDIDVKKGIKYVEEALKIEPDSAYYLDSLAWGYYKLGDCKRAAKIMKKIVGTDDGDNEEVLKHIKIIEECIKNQKTKKGQGIK